MYSVSHFGEAKKSCITLTVKIVTKIVIIIVIKSHHFALLKAPIPERINVKPTDPTPLAASPAFVTAKKYG